MRTTAQIYVRGTGASVKTALFGASLKFERQGNNDHQSIFKVSCRKAEMRDCTVFISRDNSKGFERVLALPCAENRIFALVSGIGDIDEDG